MAAQAGFAPAPFRLTGGRTTVIPLSNKSGHRGRTCTCGHLVPGQACCCYTTRCCPGSFGKEAGVLVLVDTRHGSSLALPPRRRLAPSVGLAPTLFPQTTGCFSIQLRELVGSVGNAPIRRFRFCLTTPDLQSGNRNTSLEMVAGVGITPT